VKQVVLPLGLILLTGSLAQANSAQKYFPLKAENTWKYENQSGGVSSMWIGSSAANDTGQYTLEKFPGAGTGVTVRGIGQTLYAWDTKQDRWEPLFRFGLSAGKSYYVQLPFSLLTNAKFTVVSKNWTFNHPTLQRKFTKCIRFTVQSAVWDAGFTEFIFAPGVGLISWKEQSKVGPITYTLKVATINGKKFGVTPFGLLEKGIVSKHPALKPTVLLIKTSEAWESFYAKHQPGSEAPAVDFSEKTVVVVLAGHRNTGGYGVEVTQIRWDFPKKSIHVSAQLTVPGPDTMVIMMMTHPYKIVTIPHQVNGFTKSWETVTSN